MSDDSNKGLEERVFLLESALQAVTARTIVDGQVAEFLLAMMFFEKGIAAEKAITQAFQNATIESNVQLSDRAAVWWSDSAVLVEPVRKALLERVGRQVAGLRLADEHLPPG